MQVKRKAVRNKQLLPARGKKAGRPLMLCGYREEQSIPPNAQPNIKLLTVGIHTIIIQALFNKDETSEKLRPAFHRQRKRSIRF